MQQVFRQWKRLSREILPGRIPGFEVREQQIEMAMLVERGLLHEQHVLAEAGTGTGKSFAYLIPLSFAVGDDLARGSQHSYNCPTGTAAQERHTLFRGGCLGIDFHGRIS